MKFILKINEDSSVIIDAESLEEAEEQFKKSFGKFYKEDKMAKEKNKISISKGLYGHILKLKEENFFDKPRSLAEIREELRKLTFNYPSTSFPTYLKRLIRNRILRRFQENKEGKKTWVYVNN